MTRELANKFPPGGNHDRPIGRIGWSFDGNLLASPSADHTIGIWEVSNSTANLDQFLVGHAGAVYCAAWHPTERRLATASEDTTIGVWNADDGEHSRWLQGHGAEVYSVDWRPKETLLAPTSKDGTVRLWDADFGEQISNETLLATASKDGTVRIWDADRGEQISCLEDHRGPVCSVQWSPNGNQLASASEDGTIRIWCGESFKCQQVLQSRPVRSILDVAWCPTDGNLLASGSYDRTVKIWDVESGSIQEVLPPHLKVINVEFSFDGKWLATKASEAPVRLWRTDTWKEVAFSEECGPPTNLGGSAFHPHKAWLAVLCHGDRAFRIWYDLDSFIEDSRGRKYRNAIDGAWHFPRPPDVRDASRKGIQEGTGEAGASSTAQLDAVSRFIRESAAEVVVDTSTCLFDRYRASEDDRISRSEFDACIERLATTEDVEVFSYSEIVVLQPKVLAAYTRCLMDAVRAQKQNRRGQIALSRAQEGNFPVRPKVKIKKKQRRLLCEAMIEKLLDFKVALVKRAGRGESLVILKEVTRTCSPDPSHIRALFSFRGAVQEVYDALVVRIHNEGRFELLDPWKNAAEFAVHDSEGQCAISLSKLNERAGNIVVAFEGTEKQRSVLGLDWGRELIKLTRSHLYAHAERFVEHPVSCSHCNYRLRMPDVRVRVDPDRDLIGCPSCTEALIPNDQPLLIHHPDDYLEVVKLAKELAESERMVAKHLDWNGEAWKTLDVSKATQMGLRIVMMQGKEPLDERLRSVLKMPRVILVTLRSCNNHAVHCNGIEAVIDLGRADEPIYELAAAIDQGDQREWGASDTNSKGPEVHGANVKALKKWREKLEYLRQQEPILADPAQKFQIRNEIEEAEDKILQLETRLQDKAEPFL